MERPDDRAEKAQADGAGEFGNSINPSNSKRLCRSSFTEVSRALFILQSYIPAPASHSRHPTHQNSTNAAAAIILLPNRQSCFEKVRVFKVLQPFTSTFSLFPFASGKAILSDFVRLIYESQQFQIGKHTGQIRHRLRRGDAVGLPGRADNGIVSFTLRAGGPETVLDIPRRGRVAGDCGRGCPPAGARSGR